MFFRFAYTNYDMFIKAIFMGQRYLYKETLDTDGVKWSYYTSNHLQRFPQLHKLHMFQSWKDLENALKKDISETT